MPRAERTRIFFDGGCRPNPGRIEIAVVARGEVLIERDLGHGSSMDAEWLALLRAVAVARSLGLVQAVLLGDSIAVVIQANAALSGSAALSAHATAFLTATTGMALRVRHIKRTQNLAGIALARLPR